jgi:hypothetical protein
VDKAVAVVEDVLRVEDLDQTLISGFLARLGLDLEWLPANSAIKGSYWGEPEAGIVGERVYVRDDTPVHSLLHELCHIVCMSADRRSRLDRDAGSDDLEESAVCYLQIVLSEKLPGVGADRLMSDMDSWGYSFRLGNTACWFEHDAEDARCWLIREGLLTPAGQPVFRLRGT